MYITNTEKLTFYILIVIFNQIGCKNKILSNMNRQVTINIINIYQLFLYYYDNGFKFKNEMYTCYAKFHFVKTTVETHDAPGAESLIIVPKHRSSPKVTTFPKPKDEISVTNLVGTSRTLGTMLTVFKIHNSFGIRCHVIYINFLAATFEDFYNSKFQSV